MKKKRAVGRPHSDDPKVIEIRIRVTHSENQYIKSLSESFGMNKSSFIRSLVFGKLNLKILEDIGRIPIVQRALELKKQFEVNNEK